MSGSVTLRFLSVFGPAEVERLREKVASSLELIGVESKRIHVLVSVADELVCNILEHSRASWVELGMVKQDDGIILVLRDDGEAFDSAVSIVGSSLESSGGDERHLGHYMVRQMTSSCRYGREEGGVNRLELTVGKK